MKAKHGPPDGVCAENRAVSTRELLAELLKSEDIAVFRNKHADCFVDVSFKGYLDELITARGLKRSDIIRASGLTESYGYQIFSGTKRNPSRDKLIALAIGMRLGVAECQKLLRLAGVSELYAKNRRDAVLLFGINKELGVPQMNDLLYELGESTL